MKNIIKLIGFMILSMLILTGTGCSVRHGDFTVLSGKIVRTSDFNLGQADRVKGVEGRSIQRIIVFFPVGGIPTIDEALDNALENGHGDVMTDAVVTFTSWYIPLIYGQAGWIIKGDVVKTRRN